MLEEYKKKRNFISTPEPPAHLKRSDKALTFVVQKHVARRLHYDFRLELDGVLKSWAVPNGPSIDPKVKRLAVMVEDHPLDYQSFEGQIPEGEYGAGEVIVWDRGTYFADDKGIPLADNLKKEQELLRAGLEKGKISFTLQGEKLKGSFALVRLQKSPKNWLLIKHSDQFAGQDGDILKNEKSVSSGRSLQDLKISRDPLTPDSDPGKLPGAVKAPFPGPIYPMLATLTRQPFSDPLWIFEPKLDGYRTLAFLNNSRIKLISRNKIDFTPHFTSIVAELEKQNKQDMVLDGEIVALDESGRSCFQCLQNLLPKPAAARISLPKFVIVFYVFDILYYLGYDLRSVPLMSRKEILQRVLQPAPTVRIVDYFEKDGQTVFQKAVKLGYEGVMAKQKESLYEAGKRSTDWLKIKSSLSDDFVIGGYTLGTGRRKNTFGALLLGKHVSGKELIFSGHVGTGFDEALLADLKTRLDKLKTQKSPFQEKVPVNNQVTWVKPSLVAEVKYAEETADGLLRAPVFLRLREDKTVGETAIVVDTAMKDDHLPSTPKKLAGDTFLKTLIDEMMTDQDNLNVQVEGHVISLTHMQKALWPAGRNYPAYTKRDFLVYLARVSTLFLPHLKDRPLTLSRFPGGIYGEHFFQKHWAFKVPEYVKTVSISERAGTAKEYILCNNLATLLWLGQQANLEFHSWFSRITTEGKPKPGSPTKDSTVDHWVDYPDFLIFDIDPYVYSGKEGKGEEPELNKSAFQKTCQAALWLKESLDSLSLRSYIKTSGRTGLHIFVPILPRFDFESVRGAARTFAEHLLQKHPAELTVDWAVEKRKGKIFMDFNQNVRGKTLASVYSPRPSPRASVSTPLDWKEVGKIFPTDFTIATLPARLAKTGDLWADILEKRSDLAKSLHL
jgi:bifunctional non-homologous end joining protein LigD